VFSRFLFFKICLFTHVHCMFALLNILNKFQDFQRPRHSNSKTFKTLNLEKKSGLLKMHGNPGLRGVPQICILSHKSSETEKQGRVLTRLSGASPGSGSTAGSLAASGWRSHGLDDWLKNVIILTIIQWCFYLTGGTSCWHAGTVLSSNHFLSPLPLHSFINI